MKGLVVSYVSNYSQFWCSVIEAIKQKQLERPRIIMWDSFDYTPISFGETEKDSYKLKYHTGWWRRIDDTSYEAYAFEEKINDQQIVVSLEDKINYVLYKIEKVNSNSNLSRYIA